MQVCDLLAADARNLVRFAEVLDNTRADRTMRRELPEGIGEVLRIPKKCQGRWTAWRAMISS